MPRAPCTLHPSGAPLALPLAAGAEAFELLAATLTLPPPLALLKGAMTFG